MLPKFPTAIAAIASAVFFVSAPVYAQNAGVVDPTIMRLQQRVDALEDSVRRSTGRVEQSGFQMNQLRNSLDEQTRQIGALKKDIASLSARLKAIEDVMSAPVRAASSASSEGGETTIALVGPTKPTTREAQAAERGADGATQQQPASLPEQPEELFREAKRLLLRGDYPSAEAAFNTYIERHSDQPQTGEALFHLGEALLIQEAYPEAVETYIQLVSEWPDSSKAPEGFVRLARSLRLMSDTEKACTVLDDLPVRYPDADPITKSLAASERDRSGCDG